MKKSPDAVLMLVMFFVVGTAVTGLSHADLGLSTMLGLAGR